MNSEKITILSELSELLEKLGMSRIEARALAYLVTCKSGVSKEIEHYAGLSQPEVSIAMKKFRKLGWVSEKTVQKMGRGKPPKFYELSVDGRRLIKDLTEKKKREIIELETALKRVNELIECNKALLA